MYFVGYKQNTMEQGLILTVLGAIFLMIILNRAEETFDNSSTKFDKSCSQKSINDGFTAYIFGDEKFIK